MLKAIFPAALVMVLANSSIAQEDEVKSVISSQLEAFSTGDVDLAFSFASPMIQQLFRDPQTFGEMVRQGYPMVWRSDSLRCLDLVDAGSLVRQRVEITDKQGVPHLLEYELLQIDQSWKINGVRLLRAPAPSV